MHLTGILITEQCGGLTETDRQITVAVLLCFVYIVLERTCHRTKCVNFFVFLLVSKYEHSVFVMIPVSGDLVKVALCHQRSFCSYVSTFCLLVLDPALKLLHHDHTVWHDKRKSLSDYVYRCKDLHLTAKFVMIASLSLFHLLQMLFQLILCCICSSVDTCKHCVFLASSPVCAGRRKKLECFDSFYAHQVWSCTEVCPVSLGIEGNLLSLRKILDQLYLIWLIFLFEVCDGILTGFCETLDLCAFFDDLLHLFFDGIKILTGEWLVVKIIIESCVNGWSDGNLCLRIQVLYCLCHYMRCCMTKNCKALLISCCKDVKLTVTVKNCTEIHNLSVYLSCTCCACKAFTDIICDIDYRFCFCIFFF